MENENKPEALKVLETQISEANATIAALQAKQVELQSIADTASKSVVDQVPENLRGLIPEGDALTKLLWLQKAKASGLFKPVVPATDDGKKPTITPKDVDLSSLSPFARLSAAYKK